MKKKNIKNMSEAQQTRGYAAARSRDQAQIVDEVISNFERANQKYPGDRERPYRESCRDPYNAFYRYLRHHMLGHDQTKEDRAEFYSWIKGRIDPEYSYKEVTSYTWPLQFFPTRQFYRRDNPELIRLYTYIVGSLPPPEGMFPLIYRSRTRYDGFAYQQDSDE